MIFRTLEELIAHNQATFAEIGFAKLTDREQTSFSEGEETHFEKITRKSQPHHAFNLDWKAYFSLDFADRFLPKVRGYQCKGVRFYDGAELLNGLEISDRKLLPLEDNNNLISIVSCTYPKNVEAGKKKDRVKPSSFEVCVFIETDQNKNANIFYKFGSDFKHFWRNKKSTQIK